MGYLNVKKWMPGSQLEQTLTINTAEQITCALRNFIVYITSILADIELGRVCENILLTALSPKAVLILIRTLKAFCASDTKRKKQTYIHSH